MTEQSIATGTLEIKVYDKDGNLVQQATERNLIVNGGRNSLARLLGGAGAGKQIATIGFGTNGTAASPPDSALTGAFVKAVSAVSYPQTGAVKFDWLLDYADANGTAIREFGLIASDGTLFSRKVRDLISKTAEIQIQGSWTIQF